jgi:S1-C subfamily serine protease
MPLHGAMLAAFCCFALLTCAIAQNVTSALRSAVPLLCTETSLATRTRIRGTGVIADSGGTLLTAAHVILEAHSNCTLSVMVPDDEWSRIHRPRAFLIRDCRLNRPFDLAVCRIRPAENTRDWGYIAPAHMTLRAVVAGEPVTITAFAGWGLFPLTRAGHIKGRENYQRPDGCYCNFATDIAAVEGMSGSPIISAQGEVLGIVTLAGTGKFRGMSFGASLEEASEFLKAEGVISTPLVPGVAHSTR